ncbi:hypothetical protein [Methanosarcina sp. Kolksee]|uniref:hypothetical protein n=1 Tax=Methanosarcina sp. Kolksee TaxID=1434099 RepID=UPI001E480CD4|nr:hypothetical protein [Methanosarcina sp. Kolksee]
MFEIFLDTPAKNFLKNWIPKTARESSKPLKNLLKILFLMMLKESTAPAKSFLE